MASFSTCSRQCDWVHKFRVSSTAAEAAAAREENEDMEPAAQTPREDFDLAQAVQQTAKIETLKRQGAIQTAQNQAHALGLGTARRW